MIKTVKTQSTWQGEMRVDGRAQDHIIIIDQPDDMGGRDAGPNPIEYFLISLGSCLAGIAAIIARQERIELVDFSIEVEGDYDLDYLMGKTEDGPGGLLEIRQKVVIDAELTEQEKVAFFEKVHARCPVTGSILNQTRIVSDIQ